MSESDEQISSGEGGDPPNERKPRRAQRARKLSGPEKLFAQDLVYALFRLGKGEITVKELEKEMIIITARWL